MRTLKVMCILLMTVPFFSGCSTNTTKIAHDTSSARVGNTISAKIPETNSWISKTDAILNNSEGSDGGFDSMVTERPVDLYNSYYNITLMKQFNLPIPMKSTLKSSIVNLETGLQIQKGMNGLLQAYYLLGLMKDFGISPSATFKRDVTQLVTGYKQRDGFFALTADDTLTQKIDLTDVCISILKLLNQKYHNPQLYSELNNQLSQASFNSSVGPYVWTIYESIENIDNNMGYEPIFAQSSAMKNEISQVGKTAFSAAPSNELDLLNDAALFQLSKDIGSPITPSPQFMKYLNSVRIPDGGYNVISSTVSDPQVTLQVSQFDPNQSRPYVTRYTQNLGKFQLGNGLYTTPYPIPSNVISSFMALSIYKATDMTIPEGLRDYLTKSLSKTDQSPESVYYSNLSRQMLGLKPVYMASQIKFNEAPINPDYIYSVLNENMFGKLSRASKQVILSRLKKTRQSDGSYQFGSGSTFKQTMLVLDAMKALGFTDKSQTLMKWIWSQEQSNSGFTSKGPANLIDTSCAIWILNYASNSTSANNKILSFVTKFKNADGGYSFSSSGSPSLEATFLGCMSTMMLSNHQTFYLIP